MVINISERLNKLNKDIKKGNIVMIIISVILVLEILLFVLLSNYKTQLILTIIGCITSSITALILLFIIYSYLIPNIDMRNFLKSISSSKEIDIKGNIISISDNKVTLRKGIAFTEYKIDDKKYYCCFDDINIKLKELNNKTFIIKDMYIVGYKDE